MRMTYRCMNTYIVIGNDTGKDDITVRLVAATSEEYAIAYYQQHFPDEIGVFAVPYSVARSNEIQPDSIIKHLGRAT